MGRWQNRIKQALYRPSKSHSITTLGIDVLTKLGKELNSGLSRILAEDSAAKDKKS